MGIIMTCKYANVSYLSHSRLLINQILIHAVPAFIRMKVSKDGVTGDDCNYQNVMTSWGCIHRGDAYIESNKEYYDNDTESVNIPDAANGKFIFTVEHYNSYYENDYEGDHQNVGVATITVNGNAFTTFKHPKNKNQEPINEDGTVNEDFKGTAELVVECSEDCECFVVN